MRQLCYVVLLLALAVGRSGGQASAKQSTITIHVHKAGALSSFGAGHNHTVVAPAQASIDPKGMTTEIVVLSREMKVTDEDVSEKDRA
ncbi:MAG TPA: hypothetical protein VFL42_05260, partial [Terriglobales bacterium]|nr:hypothetical protein [Terriglobales bacterium]